MPCCVDGVVRVVFAYVKGAVLLLASSGWDRLQVRWSSTAIFAVVVCYSQPSLR